MGPDGETSEKEGVIKKYFKCSLKYSAECPARAAVVSFYLHGVRKVTQTKVSLALIPYAFLHADRRVSIRFRP